MDLSEYISNQYVRASVVLIVSFIILRVFTFFVERVVLKFTAKIKTERGDIFVKKAFRSLTLLILLLGLLFAIGELSIPGNFYAGIYKILISVIIVNIAYVGYLFFDLFLFFGLKKAIVKENDSARESLMNLFRGVLRVIWVLGAILYLLDFWGFEIGPFLAGAGIAGIAIAFAMQSSLSNIFGGISLILDKSIKVGDIVFLDEQTRGKIVHIGIRSTKILSFDNEFIIVPNSKLSDGRIQNLGLPEPKSRVTVSFSIAYGSDIEKVKKIVLAELRKIKKFTKEPEPVVRFLEMADSSLKFSAYFYVESFENRMDAIDEANTRIYDVLNRNKISIPFPQVDVYLRKK